MIAGIVLVMKLPPGLGRVLHCCDKLNGSVDIFEFAEQDQKAAGGKQRPHSIPDGGQHHGTGHWLKSSHDSNDSLQAVAANIRDGGEVEYQMPCAVIRRCLHQFIELSSKCFVDITVRTKNSDRSMVFNGYCHGIVISWARDHCPGALMKVHSNSI